MISIKNTAENQYLTNYNDFIDSLVPNDLFLEIEYESDSVTGNSYFCVKYNNAIVDNFKIKKEVTNLKLELIPGTGLQTLEISMTGKGSEDTVVQGGAIVKDTFIKLLNLKINNYKLLDDHDFFLNKFEYIKHKDNAKIIPMDGFWEDATLQITFELPFDLWYNSTSTKNAAISEGLKFRVSHNIESMIQDLEENLKHLK